MKEAMTSGVSLNLTALLVYASMLLIFVIGLLKCVLPVLAVRSALKRATPRLGIRSDAGAFLYDDPSFLQCRYLNDWWSRYIFNLRELRKSNGECDVIGFINSNTAIQSPGHSQFAEIIPGLMTSLGILGTFFGLVRGVSALQIQGATLEQMQQSIAVLIEGMNSAFNTSIAGVICAVVFQLLRRLVIASTTTTLNHFINTCQCTVSKPYTQDTKLVQSIHALLIEVRKSNEAVQEVLRRSAGGM